MTFKPSVTVRTSRCSACNIWIVERISSVRSISGVLPQTELVRGNEDVLVLDTDVETFLASHLVQVGLQHAGLPAFRNLNLAVNTKVFARAIPIQIHDVDVLAGEVLAEAVDDARLVLAERRDDEFLAGACPAVATGATYGRAATSSAPPGGAAFWIRATRSCVATVCGKLTTRICVK
ncbi:MAG: hypothetical protein MZV49_05430 [Rhodopseudomonas palustris]|nr:hypothetical protein [Rhodopseudomonas palustris]